MYCQIFPHSNNFLESVGDFHQIFKDISCGQAKEVKVDRPKKSNGELDPFSGSQEDLMEITKSLSALFLLKGMLF